MTETWTPGPWFWNDSANLDRLLGKAADGTTVAVLAHDTESYMGDMREADARLITAAPEMAELLDKALGWDHDCHWMSTVGMTCERCSGEADEAHALLSRIRGEA